MYWEEVVGVWCDGRDRLGACAAQKSATLVASCSKSSAYAQCCKAIYIVSGIVHLRASNLEYWAALHDQPVRPLVANHIEHSRVQVL